MDSMEIAVGFFACLVWSACFVIALYVFLKVAKEILMFLGLILLMSGINIFMRETISTEETILASLFLFFSCFMMILSFITHFLQTKKIIK